MNTELKLNGQIALVTGASRGIGRQLALKLGSAGAQVIAVARTLGGLEELDDEIQSAGGPQATLVYLDLLKLDQIDALGPQIYERWGKLDILCGMAGYMNELIPTWQLDPPDWQRAMCVHAEANARLIRTCDPLLRLSDNARAVFALGSAPEDGRPYWTAYAASKAALAALVSTYANEVQSYGIKVQGIDPGPTATNLRKKAYPGEDQSTLQTAEQAADIFMSALLKQKA
ncbi:MAG: SDR family NAD(P)-dependent oxidoreductase [Alphaproteobacteria bacterium]